MNRSIKDAENTGGTGKRSAFSSCLLFSEISESALERRRRGSPVAITALAVLFFVTVSPSSFASSDECVVLLHGLGRTSLSMKKLENNLEKSGYIVWNQGYPSREKTIEELASVVGNGIDECRKAKARKVH
ncbi:MAG: hypothetical protein LUQ03_07180, partial [Methanomicrobiales archaeon]|nr:hypothetical protein [Methanomicrobiales archaeon]